jgi:flagellar hook-associated protein 1 FlgK
MHSTFMGLEIGKRGLQSHQKALQVTGHNISNAKNEEYSRQRVVITAADPIYDPSLSRAETPGQIGQGSAVSHIERIRNSFIDDRIVTEKNVLGYWNSKNDYIYQVEQVYNEPSDQSIRSKMDAFWASWQNLNSYPDKASARQTVVERGVALSNEVNNVFRQLDDLQKNANREVLARVNKVNLYARDIRDLNERILKSEAMGDQPNDLMDRRDALIEKLSEIIDISVGRSDEDEIIVYIGSENLVQGEIIHELQAVIDPENKGYYKVQWKKEDTPVTITGGELAGLIEIRDVILRENINKINSYAVNLVDLTNEIHRDGFGKNNETNLDFFREITVGDNPEGNFDLNNDSIDDVTAVFKVAGNNKVDSSAAIGIKGTLYFLPDQELESGALGTNNRIGIDYVETDTINSVIKKINNAKMGVVAYVNHNGQLAIKATLSKESDKRNFMIPHLEDSGQFMVGLTGILKQSGRQGAFDYQEINNIRKLLPDSEHITITPKFNPASYMAVSAEIKHDVNKIAAGQGKDVGGTGDFNKANGVGDGTNALRLANLKHKQTMIDTDSTFNDYYNSLISKIGTQGEESADRIKNQETLMTNLENLRESVSGVDLDEEMANMVAFQHGYNAAARVISTFDQMLDVIIRMGA